MDEQLSSFMPEGQTENEHIQQKDSLDLFYSKLQLLRIHEWNDVQMWLRNPPTTTKTNKATLLILKYTMTELLFLRVAQDILLDSLFDASIY